MSTTTSRETAEVYSGKDGQRCTVLEIQAGQVDLGGDLQFVSQYPEEKEFLMQPLSCLEVSSFEGSFDWNVQL
jgi:NLR family CARD domain-containing protein 3